MLKPKFASSLRGIDHSFSSNEARVNLYAFAQKQLKIVQNAAYTLSRIDPNELTQTNYNQVERFTKHTKRILHETAGICPNDANFKSKIKAADHCTEATKIRIARMRNDATLAFIIALAGHDPLQLRNKDTWQMISQLELSNFTGSSVVALLGALHKSELFAKEDTKSTAETCFRYILQKSHIMRKLTSRERSLLLWRRVATFYMLGTLEETHLKQVKTLIYYCHQGLEEEAMFMGHSEQQQIESSQTERALTRIHQTLTNIYQAAIILRYCNTTNKNADAIPALGFSSIQRLHRMMDLAHRFRGQKTHEHRSSDTHAKVALAIRDAIQQSYMQCLYEQTVGESAYTIDILMKHN
ncbi:uncharacterized protein BXIN_2845 [Babesia sp. Xinjiang]|uniref:uncharacterized protein n=1 Tax=Babesia sp. Xinjiang TaxID=462227 RepID=UPI000A265C9D|nr:uncharacterized protein BXIN_2845 [Babesia sp. Xinjiang]ORM39488.1 hypothetical protein BXIN_2845 [Babesia sp. Xinjiang]